MAKHENPVRGYVRCPVCHSASTVHQVGEGQLLATGEPPKNSRNIGLLYYKCPQCGNSSISKKVSEFVTEHMSAQETGLSAPGANIDKALGLEPVTEDKPLDVTVESPVTTVTEKSAETSPDKVSGTQVTEPEETQSTSFFTVKRVLIVFAVLLVALWVVRQLLPKPEQNAPEQGGEHVAA